MKTYYTYLYLRPDGTPYYVGKGLGRRAWDGPHNVPIPPRERVIMQNHAHENDALAAEQFLISFYGRKNISSGCLRNLTDGGEGASGTKPSTETRNRMSISQKLRHKENPRGPIPENVRERIGNTLRGRRHDRPVSAATRAKLSLAKKGKSLAPEHCLKMSLAKRGKQVPWLPHGRQPGFRHSAETRHRQSVAAIAREARSRENLTHEINVE